ncbi:MAG TPA: hypothetical protein VL283_05130 [Candidatus Baltobacteraceae bacterium]|nr:hypothetical protein [Candidatus Baltobacteraceae bacterium]
MSKRPMRQRLFIEPDYAADNAFGKPLHGWKTKGLIDPVVGQLHGFVNDMGFALMHVVNQKADGDAWKDLYDQFVLFENPGAIVVCTDDAGRVGLVQNFRLVGDRLDAFLKDPETGAYDSAAYVRMLRDKRRFAAAVEALGAYVWELPRGLAPAGLSSDVAGFIKKVAQIEAKEEGGFDIIDAELCGKVNANTTFFPHAQHVVRGTIVARGANRPEELETIGKVKMFTPEDLRRMADEDELFDGLTLASLAKAAYHF